MVPEETCRTLESGSTSFFWSESRPAPYDFRNGLFEGNEVAGMLEEMDVFLPMLFAILSGIIAMKVLLGVREGRRSRRHPVLTVEAKIVAKRQHVSRTYPADDDSHQPIDTKYYATF